MDLRVQRTKQNIINAFIKLRAKKPIEKITVKELAEKAVINKATFYLHYKDIYDLSDELENKLIEDCLSQISPDNCFLTKEEFFELTRAFMSHSELFNVLFSGSRADAAIQKIEHFIKLRIFSAHPNYRDDFEMNICLTTLIYGSFYAFMKYNNEGWEEVISALSKVTSKLDILN